MATVSVAAETIQNWQDRRTSVELLIFCSPGFIGSDSVPILSGSVDNKIVYKRIPCTVDLNAKTIRISSFNIMSTTDGIDTQTASYNAWFFAVNGAKIKRYDGFGDFRVNTVVSQTWVDIAEYNDNRTDIIQNPNAYTKDQSDARFLLASTVINAARTDAENDWTADQTFHRVFISDTPTFDLASGALGADVISSHDSAVIPANKTFSGIRLSQDDGDFNSFTVGSGSIASNLGSFAKALSGSHASSNLYATVIQAENAGPGTAKSLHVLSSGATGSTGVLASASFDVAPVATQGPSFVLQLASSGVDDLVRGIIFTSNGGNFDYGIDFLGYATIPEFNNAIRIPNNTPIVGRNFANDNDISMMKLNTDNFIEFGNQLVVNISNPYVQVGNALTGWLFQKIDSDGRLRFFRQNYGEVMNMVGADPTSGLSAIQVLFNKGGVVGLSTLKIGATNTGPGGSGRALYIDN